MYSNWNSIVHIWWTENKMYLGGTGRNELWIRILENSFFWFSCVILHKYYKWQGHSKCVYSKSFLKDKSSRPLDESWPPMQIFCLWQVDSKASFAYLCFSCFHMFVYCAHWLMKNHRLQKISVKLWDTVIKLNYICDWVSYFPNFCRKKLTVFKSKA